MELNEAIKEMTPEGKKSGQGTSFFKVLQWCVCMASSIQDLRRTPLHSLHHGPITAC